jgi:hypothetical protein
MKKINIRRIFYVIRNKYMTLNNIVLVIGLMIAIGWVFGSLNVIQRNYRLQKELDDKKKQLIVAQLDTAKAELQKKYYQTDEYKELAVRSTLGLGLPGERVLILPQNTDAAKTADARLKSAKTASSTLEKESNFVQWINFLTGKNVSLK